MLLSDFRIRNFDKLDRILVDLCDLLMQAKHQDSEYFGMVAAAVLDPTNRCVAAVNYPAEDGRRIHAERAAIDAYQAQYGNIPDGSIIITTLSPCSEDMTERHGTSCTELINHSGVHKVYAGYADPSQDETRKQFHLKITTNPRIRQLCKKFADTFLKDELDENFADGKNPGRKGLAKRSGVNTKASVSSLRNTAKHSSGEKQRMAHWLANMKAGRNKKK